MAGPRLRHADNEVRAIAAICPRSTVLCGPDATVSATLVALADRSCVHFAAHGHHEPGNFLFSHLDLADGPLMAYDVHQLETVPRQVVLSSCDVGQNVVRTGDEMLGFTAALLYSGTNTVIAGVARVQDDLSVDVMSRFYALRARGVPAAAADRRGPRRGPGRPGQCAHRRDGDMPTALQPAPTCSTARLRG